MKNPSSITSSRRVQHWGWISGWAIPPTALAQVAQDCWPRHRHTVVAPSRHALAQLQSLDLDVVVGYSLGALLLLSHRFDSNPPICLAFAPILAFDRESGLGGKTPARTRLAVQTKFDANPIAASKLYLRLLGMTDLAGAEPAYEISDLSWGLEALGSLRAAPTTTKHSQLFIGSEDRVCSIAEISATYPHLTVIPDTSHDFRVLLPRVAARGINPA